MRRDRVAGTVTSALISAATRLAPTVGAEPAKRKRKADDAVHGARPLVRLAVGTVYTS